MRACSRRLVVLARQPNAVSKHAVSEDQGRHLFSCGEEGLQNRHRSVLLICMRTCVRVRACVVSECVHVLCVSPCARMCVCVCVRMRALACVECMRTDTAVILMLPPTYDHQNTQRATA